MKASVKYKVIYRHREKYSISEMCRFFEVSRSGYYDYVRRMDVPAKDLGFFRRFLLPGLGLLCCLFFCYAIWNGYGAKTCCGFLIFFAVVMFIGYLVKGKAPAKAESAETDSAQQA